MEIVNTVRIGVTVSTAAAVLLCAYAAVPKSVTKSLPEVPPSETLPAQTEQYAAVQTAAAAEDIAAVPPASYLLRIDGNTLSIYREGERTPLETYELPAGALPDYDRILLEYGIKANNENELHALLEDYLS